MYLNVSLSNAPIAQFKKKITFDFTHLVTKYLGELESITSWEEFSTLHIHSIYFSHSRKSNEKVINCYLT